MHGGRLHAADIAVVWALSSSLRPRVDLRMGAVAMTGLTPIPPVERLLETLRCIQEYTCRAKGASGAQVYQWATDAIQEYEAAVKVQRTANSLVVKGECGK